MNPPSKRALLRGIVAAGAVLAAVATAGPATANPSPSRFSEVDLVSDQAGMATLTDPLLVNPWGLAEGPTTPLWVADNGLATGSTTHTATLYSGGGVSPIANTGRVFHLPGDEGPTGQVFNGLTDATQFVVTGPNGSGPARFLFDTESGDLLGWSPSADPANAILVKHVDGAVYKGLALWQTPLGNFLLAANFHDGRIDVFDSSFRMLSPLPDTFFHDPRLPAGYAPFNVATVGDNVYVAYAKQDAEGHDEVAGAGNGFVDVYTSTGQQVKRIASRGPLNAPWGLAIAPASFGRFAGDLLVGNFGDGHINAYHNDEFVGPIRDANNKPIVIDGLWALMPGSAVSGGTGNVWFSAGPDDEAHGLVGLITPNAS